MPLNQRILHKNLRQYTEDSINGGQLRAMLQEKQAAVMAPVTPVRLCNCEPQSN